MYIYIYIYIYVGQDTERRVAKHVERAEREGFVFAAPSIQLPRVVYHQVYNYSESYITK